MTYHEDLELLTGQLEQATSSHEMWSAELRRLNMARPVAPAEEFFLYKHIPVEERMPRYMAGGRQILEDQGRVRAKVAALEDTMHSLADQIGRLMADHAKELV